STRLKRSEEEKEELYMDLVKSRAHIIGLVEEKCLHDKVSFLGREHKGLLESKNGLEFEILKLNRDLHESQ
ncbi:unnamed protein product, partial [Ilex paraguariensis]